jgi:hypothetical protein
MAGRDALAAGMAVCEAAGMAGRDALAVGMAGRDALAAGMAGRDALAAGMAAGRDLLADGKFASPRSINPRLASISKKARTSIGSIPVLDAICAALRRLSTKRSTCFCSADRPTPADADCILRRGINCSNFCSKDIATSSYCSENIKSIRAESFLTRLGYCPLSLVKDIIFIKTYAQL